jgi:hypothetical protein
VHVKLLVHALINDRIYSIKFLGIRGLIIPNVINKTRTILSRLKKLGALKIRLLCSSRPRVKSVRDKSTGERIISNRG